MRGPLTIICERGKSCHVNRKSLLSKSSGRLIRQDGPGRTSRYAFAAELIPDTGKEVSALRFGIEELPVLLCEELEVTINVTAPPPWASGTRPEPINIPT